MLKQNNFKIFYVLSIAWQLGFLITISIVGFLFLGIFADKFFQTTPLFLFVGFAISIIVTVYEIHHLIIPLIKDGIVKDKIND